MALFDLKGASLLRIPGSDARPRGNPGALASSRDGGLALSDYFLVPRTCCLKLLATVKPTFLRAGILMASPV
jgi:hypothetical protein